MVLRINEALCPAVKIESYPKSVIQITIVVLENDGSCLGHAITCASLALMNAGIEMTDIVVGSSVGLFPSNVLALDCTEWERKHYGQTGELVLGYMLASGSISQIIFNGCIVETPLLNQVNNNIKFK